MILVLSCSCFCPIHWSQVLSREWETVGASPIGDAPTTSECSTILLPTKVHLIWEVWQSLSLLMLWISRPYIFHEVDLSTAKHSSHIRTRTKWPTFCRWNFQMQFSWKKNLSPRWRFCWIFLWGSSWSVSIGSNNGSGTKQAASHYDPTHWLIHVYVSPGFSELRIQNKNILQI